MLAQFAGLLLDKMLGGVVPLRFVAFAAVGALGVLVHLAVLTLGLKLGGLPFGAAQAVATVVAMIFNFVLNNQITYRDQLLRGSALWRGLALFMLVCGLGRRPISVWLARCIPSTPHGRWPAPPEQ